MTKLTKVVAAAIEQQQEETAPVAQTEAAAHDVAELTAEESTFSPDAGETHFDFESRPVDDASARAAQLSAQAESDRAAGLQHEEDKAAKEQLEADKLAEEVAKSAKQRETRRIAELMDRYGLKVAAIDNETGEVHFDANHIATLKPGTFETITKESARD